jgi:formiminotetrahydrofolate cyclodeaminase
MQLKLQTSPVKALKKLFRPQKELHREEKSLKYQQQPQQVLTQETTVNQAVLLAFKFPKKMEEKQPQLKEMLTPALKASRAVKQAFKFPKKVPENQQHLPASKNLLSKLHQSQLEMKNLN